MIGATKTGNVVQRVQAMLTTPWTAAAHLTLPSHTETGGGGNGLTCVLISWGRHCVVTVYMCGLLNAHQIPAEHVLIGEDPMLSKRVWVWQVLVKGSERRSTV